MVEGHRNANPVTFGIPQRLADEETIVEDVVVRKRGAFREAGRARRVLDVDWIVELERHLELLQLRGRDGIAVFQEPVPAVVENDRRAQVRAGRTHLLEHADVVRAAKRTREQEQADAGLLERVAQLGRFVSRIDVDQDRANARGGILHDYPLGPVRRPYADAVTLRYSAGEEAKRRLGGLVPELVVGGAVVLVGDDERLAGAEALYGAAKVFADCFSKQRSRA